jgi:hypothetical protein
MLACLCIGWSACLAISFSVSVGIFLEWLSVCMHCSACVHVCSLGMFAVLFFNYVCVVIYRCAFLAFSFGCLCIVCWFGCFARPSLAHNSSRLVVFVRLHIVLVFVFCRSGFEYVLWFVFVLLFVVLLFGLLVCLSVFWIVPVFPCSCVSQCGLVCVGFAGCVLVHLFLLASVVRYPFVG